jgi:shikimate 5-dehydrogenase
MPLKAQIIPHLHDITPESRLTGAVNTVVKVRLEGGVKLIGTNTDFLGAHQSVQVGCAASWMY